MKRIDIDLREDNALRLELSPVLNSQDRGLCSINGRTTTVEMAQPTFFDQLPPSTLAGIAGLIKVREGAPNSGSALSKSKDEGRD